MSKPPHERVEVFQGQRGHWQPGEGSSVWIPHHEGGWRGRFLCRIGSHAWIPTLPSDTCDRCGIASEALGEEA